MNPRSLPIVQAILLLSLSLFLGNYAQAKSAFDLYDAKTKDLIAVEPDSSLPLRKLTVAGEKALKVTAWVDNSNATYRRGDTVNFYVKANKNCYITLLDIGTTGVTTVIFPNEMQQNNYVEAGTIVSIPQDPDTFKFKVTGKRGREVVKVIATLEREEIIPAAYLQAAGRFHAVTKDLGVVATHIDTLLNNPRNPIEWAEYKKVLHIR